MLHPTGHATLNAILNAISTFFLLWGYIAIKNKKQSVHKITMAIALLTSGLFLASYLIYHYQVGSVAYPYQDWTRWLYFGILIPHVILAMIMTPFIGVGVYKALRKDWKGHVKTMRWVWPVWFFVSLSGVFVYLLLYRPL